MASNSSQDIYITAKEYFKIEQTIKQLKQQKNLTVEKLLQKFSQCWRIRQQQDFLNYLFNEHVEIIKTMIDWVLRPQKFVSQRKGNNAIRASNQRYIGPSKCKHFFQKNEAFFIVMTKAAIQNIFPIEYWFNFLFQQIKNRIVFDSSLGYFKDIMIEYFIYFDLPNETEVASSRNMQQLEQSETKIQFPVLKQLTPLKRAYKACSLILDIQNNSKPTKALKLFSDELIGKLLEICNYQAVFLFIYKVIFRCLEEENNEKQNQKGIEILKLLLKKCKADNDVFINLVHLLNQLSQNFLKGQDRIIYKCIFEILESAIIQQTIRKIKQSSFCQPIIHNGESIMSSPVSVDEDQEENVENLFQILLLMLQIYHKIHNSRSQSIIQDIFEKKIENIMVQLNQIANIVKKPQKKMVPFSSGNSIRPVTMLRCKFFQLLLKCLQIQKQINLTRPHSSLQVSIPKPQIFLLVQRYLIENSWNNNVQHVLTKIMDCLASQYHTIFLSKQYDKRILGNSFIGFLIQNFRNKYFVYLQTLRFTASGNIYIIFNISKTIVAQLSEKNCLIPTLKIFQEWKNFVFVDLKIYEEKMAKFELSLSHDQLNRYAIKSKKSPILIDEVQPIRKLIQHVNTVTDWSVRQAKRRQKISKSAIYHRSKQNTKKNCLQSDIIRSTKLASNNSLFLGSFNSIKNNKMPMLSERFQQSVELSSNQSEQIKINLAELQQLALVPKLKSKTSMTNPHEELQQMPLRKTFSINEKIEQINQKLKIQQQQQQNIKDYHSMSKRMQKKNEKISQVNN